MRTYRLRCPVVKACDICLCEGREQVAKVRLIRGRTLADRELLLHSSPPAWPSLAADEWVARFDDYTSAMMVDVCLRCYRRGVPLYHNT